MYTKAVCLLLAFQIFLSGIHWDSVHAGDGGPTQPEVHSFEPVGTNQMVDLFTGDFTYNIPLFNLPGPDGGYPINLAYHSGAQMNEEASWVGLGWNINMGTVNRQVRNLPDDFGGSKENNIEIKTDMRTNWTVGGSIGKNWELFGVDDQILANSDLAGTGNLPAHAQLSYNNYKGIGYSVNIGFTVGLGKRSKTDVGEVSDFRGDLGYNVKLDNQEGIGADATGGVTYLPNDQVRKDASVSTGFNSRTGWDRALKIQAGMITERARRDYMASASSTISFAKPVVSMSVPQAMRGMNASFTLAKGPSVPGLLTRTSYNIFFSRSSLKNKADVVSYKGIGYQYYEYSSDDAQDLEKDYRVKDVARENDGLVHKDTRRLAIPTLSYDVYSVTGQGIGNMFRPFRSDIGTVVAPRMKSEYNGGSLGLEFGKTIGGKRLGLDLGYNYSHSKTDLWPNSNAADMYFQYGQVSLSGSVYFQNYGEMSSDNLVASYGASVASNQPVAYALKPNDNFYDITQNDLQINTARPERKKRALGTEAFTNSTILNGSTSLLPEFALQHYNMTYTTGYNPSELINYDLTRSGLPKMHVGGYIATNDAGMRYVYGLPSQNKLERDVSFSVPEVATSHTQSDIDPVYDGSTVKYDYKGTDKYYNSVQKSTYSNAYLLTSILGTDYVDFDDEAGPSDGDIGYWVRFNYTRPQSAYKWRSPYTKAIYDKGYETSFTDGKGHYSYGEKEIWYVATVETKTHVAEFILSKRKDCREVTGETAPAKGTEGYYKLDRVDVYVKSERYPAGSYNGSAKPVQSCHFVYDYSLCQNTPDNNASQSLTSNELSNEGGKLTLKKFYFTYRNNTRGASTPYTFDYNTTVGGQPVYFNRAAVDRWGNYQPGDTASNVDYPYNDPYLSAATMHERAGLWNLKGINLPSGGRYEIDYESDSYAYVQNEVAMHQFRIVSLDKYSEGASGTGDINHPRNASVDHRRVYFKLEEPLSVSLSEGDLQTFMNRYIRENEYLYFKVKINVNRNVNTTEMVGGYVRVSKVGVDESSDDGSGKYQWGYVELDKMYVDGEPTDFHPFTEAGARHIRYNQPDILYANPPHADKEKLSKSDIKNVGYNLLANGQDFKSLFSDFTNTLYDDGDGRLTDIALSQSYIRLRTPDKVKYGGGHRVKEIRILDNWADAFLSTPESPSVYGTVYDYNMEEDGRVISSGVAAYEPLIGGDEIALRNPVKGWEKKNILAKTTAQTYTEEPGNESLFPGPTVGYRKVTVMSKATAAKQQNASNAASYTGISVHEFYTAKDYPVITRQTELETDKSFRKSKLLIPALIVNIDRLRMAATQGYYIELNNMHGKPKGAQEIAFNSSGAQEIISSVQYAYNDEAHFTTNRAGETLETRTLKNEVDVLYADVDPNDGTRSDIRTSTLGTEVEFIPETRYNESKSISAGLALNFEILPVFFMLYPIPSFNWSEEKTGTVVTNKIVNKSGILKKVTATSRGSILETNNLVFDHITGQPLLTSVTNAFEDKVYNYTVLAKDAYPGTGPAYQNIGVSVLGTATGTTAPNGIQHISLNTFADGNMLFPGDQLIAVPQQYIEDQYYDNPGLPKKICYFKEQVLVNDLPVNNYILETKEALSGLYRFTIIRSGRRNLLTVPVSQITALSDPTQNRTDLSCPDGRNLGARIRKINQVLSISAIELAGAWYKDTRQLSTVPSTWYSDNAFFNRAFEGNYSTSRSHAYIDNRVLSDTIDLRKDGVLNGVRLFDWSSPLAVSTGTGCKNNWRAVDQVTLKNASSFDIESKNILGTFSSKLYGQGGTEPIAVAANAKNTEIGFENFEEYPTGHLPISTNTTNNLNFYSIMDQSNRVVEDRFDVVDGLGQKGYLDVPLSALSGYTDFVLALHIDGFNSAPEEKIRKISPVFDTYTDPLTNIVRVRMTIPVDANVATFRDRRWRGELFGRKAIPNFATSSGGMKVEKGIAHTGDRCISTGQAECVQTRLNLAPNESYQFSGWFSSADNTYLLKNYDKLFLNDMQLKFYDGSGGLVSTLTLPEKDILQGSFIDEWQKFNVNFTMPATAKYVSIVFPKINALQSLPQIGYFDDLRIQPADAGMETYVYNSENQRLEAVLDGNNYATFYYYDDEGSLFLVKRETEKGIITVQESRNHIRIPE